MKKNKGKPILIHIPKTGGTTLRSIFKLPKLYKVHRKIGSPPMRRAIQKAGDSAYAFAFLRHPLDRAMSAYNFFVYGRNQNTNTPPGFNAVKQKAWLFSVVAQASGMDVNQFYQGMLKNNNLQYRRMCKVIIHFMPQAHWMKLAEAMGVKIHCYNFHKFGSEYERLLDDMGWVASQRPKLEHRMKNPHAKADLAWGNMLDKETQDLLSDFYAEDFALLRREGIIA